MFMMKMLAKFQAEATLRTFTDAEIAMMTTPDMIRQVMSVKRMALIPAKYSGDRKTVSILERQISLMEFVLESMERASAR